MGTCLGSPSRGTLRRGQGRDGDGCPHLHAGQPLAVGAQLLVGQQQHAVDAARRDALQRQGGVTRGKPQRAARGLPVAMPGHSSAEARGKQRKRLPGSLARGMGTNCSGHSPVPSQQSGFPGRKDPWRGTSQHVPPQHQRCRGWILPGLRPLFLNGRGSGAGTYGARECKSLAWALFGSRGLCPGWGLSVLLWTCPEIRDLTATLGTKGRLFKCCQSRQEMRMSAGEKAARETCFF